MSREVRNGVILAVLLLALAVLWLRAWRQIQPADEAAVGGPANPQEAGQPRADAVPVVDLAALDADRPAPAEARRNLFQYGGTDRPASAPAPVFTPPPSAVTPPSASAESTLSLKLIGIVQPLDDSPRVAVLSDERGVYHGTTGTIIEGRYRIVRVEPHLVELTTLDGSGLFVLRLPAS